MPTVMKEMMQNKNTEKLARATEAFLKMKKFYIAELKKAYEGLNHRNIDSILADLFFNIQTLCRLGLLLSGVWNYILDISSRDCFLFIVYNLRTSIYTINNNTSLWAITFLKRNRSVLCNGFGCTMGP